MDNIGKVFRTVPGSGPKTLASKISYYFAKVKMIKHLNLMETI